MTDKRLEPCPACGHAHPIVGAYSKNGHQHFQIICPKCKCAGPKLSSYKGAMIGWNSILRSKI